MEVGIDLVKREDIPCYDNYGVRTRAKVLGVEGRVSELSYG